MGKSRTYVRLDHRGRIAVGQYARHDLYLLNVLPNDVIELTPMAELDPAAAAPKKATPRRRPPKRAAPAAAEKPQEQE